MQYLIPGGFLVLALLAIGWFTVVTLPRENPDLEGALWWGFAIMLFLVLALVTASLLYQGEACHYDPTCRAPAPSAAPAGYSHPAGYGPYPKPEVRR